MRRALGMAVVLTVGTVGMGMFGGIAVAGQRGAFTAPQVQKGYYDGHLDGFVSTDTSTKAQASAMSINYSPVLASMKRKSFPFIYMVMGTAAPNQLMVLGSEPGEDDYSPIWNEVDVRWNPGVTPVLLTSDTQIDQEATMGNVTKAKPGILLNCPVIAENVGPGAAITPPKVFKTSYDGHKDGMLATDVSTNAQASRENINYSPVLAMLNSDLFPEIYIVRGHQAAGQLMVLGSEPGEDNYSPLWRETIVRWKKGVTPTVIKSDTRVDQLVAAGKAVERETAVILNCPVTSEP
jgi:hypothetical protein